MATCPTSDSTVDFSNGEGQTERFWIYYRIRTRHYSPEHGVIYEKRGERMISIASVCPRLHAHEQSEIKEHQRAWIKLQAKNQYSRRFFHKDYLWVNAHRPTREGRRVDRG